MDEFLALAYHQERRLDCVIVRLFNTVGPRQSGQYGMVIPRFVERALAGAPLEIHGDGMQTRSFCHVSDTVRALKGLMDDGATTGEIYNVGSTERISILELAERVQAKTRSRLELTFVPYEQVYGLGIEDTLHREPAIDKVREAIGWRPTLDLDRILADVIEHTRRAPVLVESETREDPPQEVGEDLVDQPIERARERAVRLGVRTEIREVGVELVAASRWELPLARGDGVLEGDEVAAEV